jgi:hypothetical protein
MPTRKLTAILCQIDCVPLFCPIVGGEVAQPPRATRAGMPFFHYHIPVYIRSISGYEYVGEHPFSLSHV